jgi:hypothetical protein
MAALSLSAVFFTKINLRYQVDSRHSFKRTQSPPPVAPVASHQSKKYEGAAQRAHSVLNELESLAFIELQQARVPLPAGPSAARGALAS